MALWTPADLPNNPALWLDAADAATITESGGLISQWNDKSGNARHVMSTGAGRPTYTAAAQNGLSVVEFSGAQYLDQGSANANLNCSNKAVTIFAVAKSERTSEAAEGFVVLKRPTGPDYYHTILERRTTNYALSYGDGGTGSFSATRFRIERYANSDITNYNVLAVTVNTTATSHFLNGSAAADNLESGTMAQASYLTSIGANNSYVCLGARVLDADNGYANWLDGKLGEVIILTTVPTAATRERIEGYLAWKWGRQAALPATHPYAFAAPATNDVAPPTNHVVNGGYETGDLTGWTVENAGERFGTFLFDNWIILGGAADALSTQWQWIAVPPGATSFRLSHWGGSTATDTDNGHATVRWYQADQVTEVGSTSTTRALVTGPVIALRQVSGSIPAGAAWVALRSIQERITGTANNGAIDEIWLQFNAPAAWQYDDRWAGQVVSRLVFDEADGATSVTDRAASPPDWTFFGGARVQANSGPWDGCGSLRLDGDSDYITTTGLPGIFDGETSSYTLRFWLTLDSLAASQGIFSIGDPGQDANRFLLCINSSSQFNFFVSIGGVTIGTTTATVGSVLTAGEPAHITIMKIKTHFVCFVNGAVLGAFYNQTIPNMTDNLAFGRARLGGVQKGMAGTISDVQITAQASQRINYYNPTSWLDGWAPGAAALPLLRIGVHPAPVAANAGAVMQMSVTLSHGTGAIYYQWYGPAGLLRGETASRLAIEATPEGAGDYYCVVRDTYGQSVTSNTAALTVTVQPPVVSSGATDTTVPRLGIVTVAVSASGFRGLSYQWHEDGVGAIPGATRDTYSFQVDAPDSGRAFYCVVEDAYGGSVQSATGTVTVYVATVDDQSDPLPVRNIGYPPTPAYVHYDWQALLWDARGETPEYHDTYRFQGRTFRVRDDLENPYDE